ncbi:MAG: hypothetical protein Q7T55_09115 [Solirubrobacteraceae bacterium]|nr:hypothetical protein [Solirubrobacteraceae bacterium]
MSRLRSLASLLAATAALVLVALAPPATAAVGVRAVACNAFSIAFWPPYEMTITKPAGTVMGDLMIATVRTSGFYSASSGPSGWTEYLNDGASSVTWYKWATASEPGSYVFGGPSGGGSMAGGIVSFSGVNPTTPFADARQTTNGTAAAVTLPGATGTTAGSMRYSTITSGDNVSVTFAAGLTEACDRNVGSVGMASAYEATGVGAVATRTATRSGGTSNVAQTFVLNPAPSCNAGGLTMTPPSAISFPTTVLSGVDQTRIATPTIRIDDQRAISTGWNLSTTSTAFQSGSNYLPDDAVRLMGVAPSSDDACVAPTNLISGYPLTVPALPGIAPAASKVYNAAIGTGSGPVDLTLNLHLRVPARARVGNYTSTWTFTLAAGP